MLIKFCCELVRLEYAWLTGGKINEGGSGASMFMWTFGLWEGLILCWYESIEPFDTSPNLQLTLVMSTLEGKTVWSCTNGNFLIPFLRFLTIDKSPTASAIGLYRVERSPSVLFVGPAGIFTFCIVTSTGFTPWDRLGMFHVCGKEVFEMAVGTVLRPSAWCGQTDVIGLWHGYVCPFLLRIHIHSIPSWCVVF